MERGIYMNRTSELIVNRVYFRISLKKGQTHRSKFQGVGGGGQIQIPRGGESTPPPEINPGEYGRLETRRKYIIL
jgi:hypothetical protein